jgi:hypothetical protein
MPSWWFMGKLRASTVMWKEGNISITLLKLRLSYNEKVIETFLPSDSCIWQIWYIVRWSWVTQLSCKTVGKRKQPSSDTKHCRWIRRNSFQYLYMRSAKHSRKYDVSFMVDKMPRGMNFSFYTSFWLKLRFPCFTERKPKFSFVI